MSARANWGVAAERWSGLRVTLFLLAAIVVSSLFFAAAKAQPISAAIAVQQGIESARLQLNVRPELAIALAQKSADFARLNVTGPERDILLSESDAVIARAHVGLRNIDEAETAVRRGFARVNRGNIPPRVVGELTLSSGRIHQYRDEVQGALKDYHRAYQIFRSVGEKRSQAIALQSIAKLYVDGGDARIALRYYVQSDEEYAGDPSMSLSSHNNRGKALLDLGQPQDAEREFNSALEIADKIGSAKYVTRILNNIAQAQVRAEQLDAASRTVDRAFASVQTEDAANEIWALWELRAQIALGRGDIKTATSAIERALADVDPRTSEDIFRQAHFTAYEVYGASRRAKSALLQLEAVWRLDQTAAKLTATNSAALMAARFDFANQNTKIARLKAAELELQRNFLIAVIAGGALMLLLLSVGLIMITRSRNRERAAKLLLARTNCDLEKAIAAKMEFLATTSHEIRTPLNGILGMTQVMLADRGLDAVLRDRIGIVHGAGETMRALVDDILDVAKMETGKLSVGTGAVELKATLRQVAQVWRLQAEASGVMLKLNLDECPEQMEGDAGRIRQIVFNLLSNAMKFTENGKVELSARVVEAEDAPRIRISVRDSGIGIDRKWHESIFELFEQVDGGTTRKYGGTGLGLAICRNLARAMSGDIMVESELGFGSTFTIDLPFVEPAAVPAVVPSDGARGRTVLVIEHNPLTRGMMRAILCAQFDVIAFVDSVAEACSFLALEQADWIVADASSVENFTQLFDATDLPIVLVEGNDPVAIDVRLRAHVVLAKPLTKAILLDVFFDNDQPVLVAA